MIRNQKRDVGAASLCVIALIGLVIIPGKAQAQLDFLSSDLVMKHVNFIRGDIEISDPNTENEKLLYTNPEGSVQLQIVTERSVFDVQAKLIQLSSGQNEVLAENVTIDDGTTSVRGNTGRYWINEGRAEFAGDAAFKQKLDRERANQWSGEKIQVLFADGAVKKITLKGGASSGRGRLYPQKGQMSRYLPGYRKEKPEEERPGISKPEPVKEPEPTPTPRPLQRILAPIAE